MGTKLSKPTPANGDQSKNYLKRFDVEEIEVLSKVYKELSARSPAFGIDKGTFLEYFPLPGLWGERLFQHFDHNGNGSVDFDEFLRGIAVCCRGTKSDRIQVLFNAFDLNNDGYIQKSELVAMLSNIPDLLKFVSVSKKKESTLQASLSPAKEGDSISPRCAANTVVLDKVQLPEVEVKEKLGELKAIDTGGDVTKATHNNQPVGLERNSKSVNSRTAGRKSRYSFREGALQKSKEERVGEGHASDTYPPSQGKKKGLMDDREHPDDGDDGDDVEDGYDEEDGYYEDEDDYDGDDVEEAGMDPSEMRPCTTIVGGGNENEQVKEDANLEKKRNRHSLVSKITLRRYKEKRRQMKTKKNPSVLAQSLIAKEQQEEINEVQEDVEILVDEIIEECEFVEYGQLSSMQFKAWLEKNDGILKMFTDCLHEEVWGIAGNALYRSDVFRGGLDAPPNTSLAKLQPPTGLFGNTLFPNFASLASLRRNARKIQTYITQERFPLVKRFFQDTASNTETTTAAGNTPSTPILEHQGLTLSNGTPNGVEEKASSAAPLATTFNESLNDTPEPFLHCPNCKLQFTKCRRCSASFPSLSLVNGEIRLACKTCLNGVEKACWNCNWEFQKCTELLSHSHPVKAGTLYKIGKHVHKWIARYFVLIDNALYYYKKKDDPQPTGFLFLESCYVEYYDSPHHISKFGLSINHISEKVPRRILFADSAEDRRDWILALRVPMKQHNLNHIYSICEQIGQGKFSVVYRGVHRETGSEYAIKVIDKGKVSNHGKQLLWSETLILPLLRFPNVIYFKEVLDTKEQLYIAMELVKGGELYDLLYARRRLPELLVNRIVKQLLSTVAYLHKCGIIHRDIKPENILLIDKSPETMIKLTDFGLSALCGPDELLFDACGTLAYVAPEVLLLKGYNHKVDLWSIGVVSFLLLGGKLPFPTVGSLDNANFYSHYTLKFEGNVWKEISSSAKDLVWRLLQPHPEDRICVNDALKHIWITNPTAVINEASPERLFDDEPFEEYVGNGDPRLSPFAEITYSSFLISSVLHNIATEGNDGTNPRLHPTPP